MRQRVPEQPVGDGQAAQRAAEDNDRLWHGAVAGPSRGFDVARGGRCAAETDRRGVDARVYDDDDGCFAARQVAVAWCVSLAIRSVFGQTPLSFIPLRWQNMSKRRVSWPVARSGDVSRSSGVSTLLTSGVDVFLHGRWSPPPVYHGPGVELSATYHLETAASLRRADAYKLRAPSLRTHSPGGDGRLATPARPGQP